MIRTRILITSQGQAQAWLHLGPRHLHVPTMRPGNIQLGAIVGAGEGAMITGRRITVNGDAAAAAVMAMVMVVAVDEAAVPRAGKQGIPMEQRNTARMDPDRYHPPQRSSPRQCQILQLIPSIRAAAIRQTIHHTPHNCNNLALHNRIRRCRSRSCRRKYNHISIHDLRSSLV